MEAAVLNAALPGAGAARPGQVGQESGLHFDVQASGADIQQFKAMLDQHSANKAIKVKPGSQSLGSAVAERTTQLASEVKQDQLYVSKLLEDATRTGDSKQLMKAMLALNDFQVRAQTITKVVSKVFSSIDSLVKLS